MQLRRIFNILIVLSFGFIIHLSVEHYNFMLQGRCYGGDYTKQELITSQIEFTAYSLLLPGFLILLKYFVIFIGKKLRS